MTLESQAISRLLKAFSNSESEMWLWVSLCVFQSDILLLRSLGLELYQWPRTSSWLHFVFPVDLRLTSKSNLSAAQPECRSVIPLHFCNQMVLQAQSDPWTSDRALIFMTTSDTCLNHRGIYFPYSADVGILHISLLVVEEMMGCLG